MYRTGSPAFCGPGSGHGKSATAKDRDVKNSRFAGLDRHQNRCSKSCSHSREFFMRSIGADSNPGELERRRIFALFSVYVLAGMSAVFSPATQPFGIITNIRAKLYRKLTSWDFTACQ